MHCLELARVLLEQDRGVGHSLFLLALGHSLFLPALGHSLFLLALSPSCWTQPLGLELLEL